MTENIIGNLTTIVKYISMLIAGWAIGIAVAHGLNLPISEAQLSELIFMLIMLIVGYIDSKYPNTFGFLGNAPKPLNTNETVLNDEYEAEE